MTKTLVDLYRPKILHYADTSSGMGPAQIAAIIVNIAIFLALSKQVAISVVF